tara:strand:- start:1573 stop:2175 length:603 start_codon:yes stop_codon:yes gene_type:complete
MRITESVTQERQLLLTTINDLADDKNCCKYKMKELAELIDIKYYTIRDHCQILKENGNIAIDKDKNFIVLDSNYVRKKKKTRIRSPKNYRKYSEEEVERYKNMINSLGSTYVIDNYLISKSIIRQIAIGNGAYPQTFEALEQCYKDWKENHNEIKEIAKQQKEELDDELDAMVAIRKILNPFNIDQRQRIIKFFENKYKG